MNFKDIVLCPRMGKLNCRAIASLLATGLFNGSAQARKLLSDRYMQMKKNCGRVPHDDSRWDLDGIIADKTDKAALLSVPHIRMGNCGTLVNKLWDHQNFGLDMPTWMVKRGGKDKRRVMIVLQDPFRKNHKVGRLVLSTPFGFHSTDYRNICCRNHTICCFVERLLEECRACVYLTDCRKFYTSDNFVNSHKKQFKGLFDKTLGDELTVVAPDMIVTLGNDAADALGARHAHKGFDVQEIGRYKLIAAHHTNTHFNHFKTGNKDWCKEEYFAEVFKVVRKELRRKSP